MISNDPDVASPTEGSFEAPPNVAVTVASHFWDIGRAFWGGKDGVRDVTPVLGGEYKRMVPPPRFELGTSALQMLRSTN